MICGYVFSNDYKKPIENANVNLLNKTQVTTNSNGYFEFRKDSKNTLLISHVGFITKKIVVNNSSSKKLPANNIRVWNNGASGN